MPRPSGICKRKAKAPLPTLGTVLFFMPDGSGSIPVSEPAPPLKAPPQLVASKARRIEGSPELPFPHHPIRSGRNPGYPRSLPKNGRQKPNGIRASTSPAPFHPERTGNRRLRQRPQTEGKEGGGSRKIGKPESRKAGKSKSRKVKKPGSQKAGKQKSRAEAQKGIKKRRRTVGCTSACGPLRSLAYRNYLLR